MLAVAILMAAWWALEAMFPAVMALARFADADPQYFADARHGGCHAPDLVFAVWRFHAGFGD